ncbi:MAG: hypothetical protein A4E53_03843 [Pelotomaculum sp. PtaB.Bin104]|nr:MAG: hypothetical protein A4E53_03843 [Pelotomaculum sp. PtaB.Bin104]
MYFVRSIYTLPLQIAEVLHLSRIKPPVAGTLSYREIPKNQKIIYRQAF